MWAILADDCMNSSALQANVVITDSTSAGKVMFTETSIEVPHLSKFVLVPVAHKMRCDSDISVSYNTVDGTAKAGMFPVNPSCL